MQYKNPTLSLGFFPIVNLKSCLNHISLWMSTVKMFSLFCFCCFLFFYMSFEKKPTLFEIFFYFLFLLFYTIWFLCCSHRVLTISRGLDEVGGLNWQLTLCFLGAWLVVFLCLIKGVKSLGKVCWHNASIELILLNHY